MRSTDSISPSAPTTSSVWPWARGWRWESPRKLLSHVPKHEETLAPQGGPGFRVLDVNQTQLRKGLLSWMNGAGGHREQPQLHLREVCRDPTAIAGYGSTEGGSSGQMAHGSGQCECPPKL